MSFPTPKYRHYNAWLRLGWVGVRVLGESNKKFYNCGFKNRKFRKLVITRIWRKKPQRWLHQSKGKLFMIAGWLILDGLMEFWEIQQRKKFWNSVKIKQWNEWSILIYYKGVWILDDVDKGSSTYDVTVKIDFFIVWISTREKILFNSSLSFLFRNDTNTLRLGENNGPFVLI